jgi:hypothetical protein
MARSKTWRFFAGDAEDVAEFGEAHLVVRALGGTGVFPTGDE